jgi:ADP-ribose pyrophosphatase YjhB (NUDIX family)
MQDQKPGSLRLPQSCYRVSAKALIFDERQRLLVFKDKNGEWEVPGGGLDHDEDYQSCLKRELAEEVAAEVKHIGPLAFFYRQHDEPRLALAFPVELVANSGFTPGADDLVEARFVSKEEFLQLPFQKSEAAVKQHAEQIWQG